MGKNNKSSAFVGLTTVDICSYVEEYPGANTKTEADNQYIFAGGPAANAAVAYAAFGNRASLYSYLGKHPLAAMVKDDLHKHHVEFMDMQKESTVLPALSTIIVSAQTGDRAVIYKKGKYNRADVLPDEKQVLSQCDMVLCDGHLIAESVRFAHHAKKQNIPVVADFGSWRDGLEELLPYIDVAICSADFVPPTASSADDPEATIDYLCENNINRVAVSRGAGQILAYVSGTRTNVDVPQTQAIDTLGAGDILHGTFCHFYHNHGFLVSLSKAAEVASLSTEYVGTRAWISSLRSSTEGEKGEKAL